MLLSLKTKLSSGKCVGYMIYQPASTPYSRVVASVFASIDCTGSRIQKNFHGNALMTLPSDAKLAIQSIIAKLYYSCDCTRNIARSTGIWAQWSQDYAVNLGG